MSRVGKVIKGEKNGRSKASYGVVRQWMHVKWYWSLQLWGRSRGNEEVVIAKWLQ